MRSIVTADVNRGHRRRRGGSLTVTGSIGGGRPESQMGRNLAAAEKEGEFNVSGPAGKSGATS